MTFEDQARQKLEKYIGATELVFKSMSVSSPADASLEKSFEANVALSRQYMDDSRYYLEKGDFITALVCIAYCEGILDACRNLGWLTYEWKGEQR
jgi:hypothetical protein